MALRRREFYEAWSVRISILATAISRYAVYVDADHQPPSQTNLLPTGGPYVFERLDNMGVLRRMLRAGAQGYLLKPFNRAQLLESFRSLEIAA